ncbi:hypothetical protein [Jannaschia sp. LMIT008]|uniref:hypothetical protein n=1 Tax=Jannaschia maritima TaxID=3032585 RepID=UPI002810CC9E|nr:hypothetical protein [Jannaschia sp. LMIT008]
MTHFRGAMAPTVLAALWTAVAATVAPAQGVRLAVVPLGIPTDGDGVSLHSVTEHADLMDENVHVFDSLRPDRWSIPVRPTQFRNDARLRIAHDGAPDTPLATIGITLPYMATGEEKAIVQVVERHDGAKVRAAYRNEALAKGPIDWMSNMVHAARQVDSVTGGGTLTVDEISPVVARGMVVYANSVSRLVEKTNWFDFPSDLEQRRDLLSLARTRATRDEGFQVSAARLERAERELDAAAGILYGRYWQAIKDTNANTRCFGTFPVTLAFHDHLRGLDAELYDTIVDTVGFTRTQVLSETVRCFRMLLSRDGAAQFALDAVMEEPFGGNDPLAVLAALRNRLDDTRFAILSDPDVAADPFDPECSPAGVSIKGLTTICADLAYLDSVQPDLIRGASR